MRIVTTVLAAAVMTFSWMPSEAATGGPDAFGYVFDDSTEVGGPTYNFEDISATGTAVVLADDEVSSAVPLGFLVEFYGIDYSNIYISSNGLFTFIGTLNDGCCTGLPFPSSESPNATIGAWWEDLNPTAGGTIHYQTLGTAPNSYFIAQFTDIQHFGGGNPVTVQLKLFEGSEEVQLHYQAAPSDGSTHSVGIENELGKDGLQYFIDTTALASSLAVRFQLVSGLFVDSDRSTSTVQEGGSFEYLLRVGNINGAMDPTVTVSDTLPANVSLLSASPSQGSCSGTTTINCDLGAMAAGSRATVTLTVSALTADIARDSATVSGSLADAYPANNSSSTAVAILPLSPPPLYGSDGSGVIQGSSNLYLVDPATFGASTIGSTGFTAVGGLDMHPTTAVLYGVDQASGQPASPRGATQQLLTLDTSTGIATGVGLTGMLSSDGLTFRDSDSALFTIGQIISGDELASLNTATGAATPIGITGLSPFTKGIAFSSTGTLYYADDTAVYTLNPATGVASTITTLSFPSSLTFSSTVLAMERLPGSNLLYVTASDSGGGERALSKGYDPAKGPGLNNVLGILDPVTGEILEIATGPTFIDALAFGLTPAISVTKTPATQTVLVGDPASFTITASNPGDVPLSSVIVDDPLCDSLTGPTGDDGDNILQTTETWSWICTINSVLVGLTNTVTVSATPPIGLDVTDSASADVATLSPAIAVSKSPATQTILTGSNADFTVSAANTGDADLTGVIISDPLCDSLTGPTGDDGDNVLEPGETWSWSCTVNNVTADFTNSATVTGTPALGPAIFGLATADVVVAAPGILVSKDPATQTILSGGDATFNIDASNTGSENLTTVVVNDPLCDSLTGPTGDDGDNILEPGETWSWVCTVNAVTADFTNSATVTGTPPLGPDVSGIDTADVTVLAPAIAVTKDPASQTISSGSNATFTVSANNSGDADLTGVLVSDPLCDSLTGPTGDDGDNVLEPAETWSWTCTVNSVIADFTNSATVTGTPPIGPDVSDSETADVIVTVIGPTIAVPTLSQLGLLAFASMLAVLGLGILRRR